MNLFETTDRSDESHMRVDETLYEFFNRSASDYSIRLRDRLESWFKDYPEKEKSDLVSSFKNDWYPSYFELLLFRIFRTLKFGVVVHPEMENTTKRPDFMLSKDGIVIYAEARLARDKSEKEEKVENITNEIVDKINKNVASDSVFLSIYDIQIKQIKSEKLQELYRRLNEYIEENKEKIRDESYWISSERYKDRFIYECESFRIECSLIPRTKSTKKPVNIVGIQGSAAQIIDPIQYLKNAINRKASRYGKLDKPFIVCVQIGSVFGAHDSELDDLMFGQGVYSMTTKSSFREHNGMFGSEDNPKMTRVSGVLFVRSDYMVPESTTLRYYENPNAKYPFDFGGLIEKHSYNWKSIQVQIGEFDSTVLTHSDLN